MKGRFKMNEDDKNLQNPERVPAPEGVSSESYKALFIQYKKMKEKLEEENDVLLDVNMQVNDLLAVYTDAKDGDDIVRTLRRILTEYDTMKTELEVNQVSFTGGRIAVKDVEAEKGSNSES